MPTEIWINALQHEPIDDDGRRMRRLTPAEVHQRVIDRRAGWLAWELGRHEDDRQIALAIETHPELAAAVEPRQLDENRLGIVVDEQLLDHVRTAIGA